MNEDHYLILGLAAVFAAYKLVERWLNVKAEVAKTARIETEAVATSADPVAAAQGIAALRAHEQAMKVAEKHRESLLNEDEEADRDVIVVDGVRYHQVLTPGDFV